MMSTMKCDIHDMNRVGCTKGGWRNPAVSDFSTAEERQKSYDARDIELTSGNMLNISMGITRY